MRAARSLAATLAILVVSRAVGILREFLITVAFGFTKLTDLFFQATFVPTYILNIVNGPFATALIASLNQAPPAERGGHLRRYRRRSLLIGLAIAPLFFLGGAIVAGAVGGAHGRDILVVCALLAPACAAMVIIGYAAAAANACGMIARASGLTTTLNVTFVLGVLLIWLSGVRGQSWLLPTAFTFAAVLAAGLGWRWLDYVTHEGEAAANAGGSPQQKPARLGGLRLSFGLALGETAAFIGTQLLVLALASHVSEGWASAATIAQRVALSVLGLVVVPVTNLVTVTAMNRPQQAHQIYGASALALFVGAAIIAIATYALRGPLESAIGSGWGRFDARSAHLLMLLLPPYSLWMVAMVTNAMATRMLFGMGRGRLFAKATISGYLVANLMRLAAYHNHDFPLAIALGGAIELLVGGSLCILAYVTLRRRSDAEIDSEGSSLHRLSGAALGDHGAPQTSSTL